MLSISEATPAASVRQLSADIEDIADTLSDRGAWEGDVKRLLSEADALILQAAAKLEAASR